MRFGVDSILRFEFSAGVVLLCCTTDDEGMARGCFVEK
jgi:hypothetical protein